MTAIELIEYLKDFEGVVRKAALGELGENDIPRVTSVKLKSSSDSHTNRSTYEMTLDTGEKHVLEFRARIGKRDD